MEQKLTNKGWDKKSHSTGHIGSFSAHSIRNSAGEGMIFPKENDFGIGEAEKTQLRIKLI